MTGDAEASRQSSAWWSDAERDPWRDPSSAPILVNQPASQPPPVIEIDDSPARSVTGWAGPRLVALVAVVGLSAGVLGGAVGFVAAVGRQAPRVVLGAGMGGSPAPAARPPTSLPAIVRRVLPSVVTIQGTSPQGETIGSGFVISTSGYLLTNEHVIADVPDRGVHVTFADGGTSDARVIGRDRESDLAVLKVDRSGLSPVEFADSDSVSIGDGVIAVGSPLALSGTVTAGIISAIDRTMQTTDVGSVPRYYAAIQTDAAVNRGNSGGPLFDYSGRVVGINSVIKSLVQDGEEAGNIGIAFAIPIDQAVRIASDIIDTGHARRTVIGARFDSGVGDGVRLSAVDANGPAATAGLRSGDVVVRLGDHRIIEPVDLIALVRRYDPGTVVTIAYRRGGATHNASVTLVADAK